MKASKLQKISCISILIIFGGKLYAQAYYMHEAAEDAGYRNDGISFLSTHTIQAALKYSF